MGIGLCVLVCTHEVESRQQAYLHALLLQEVCNHIGADNLALRYDVLLFETCEEVFCERTEIVKFRCKELASALLIFVGRVEFLYVLHIFLLKIVDYIVSSVGVLLVEIIGNLDE